MHFHGLLKSDTQIRFSFGSPEDLDFDTLPDWVQRLDDVRSRTAAQEDVPVFVAKGGVRATATLQLIERQNDLRLLKVTARRKINDDQTVRVVIGYLFGLKGNEEPTASGEALSALRSMLGNVWEQVKIYRVDAAEKTTSLNISFHTWVKELREPNFSGENAWGIRKLLTQK